MVIKRAIIPLAGLATRLYPASQAQPKGLITLVDRDGIAKAAIQIMVEECVNSGIEEIILVVNPHSADAYKKYFSSLNAELLPKFKNKLEALQQSENLGSLGRKLQYRVQDEPRGFGHAVWQGVKEFPGEPFCVLLGDHLFLSNEQVPCLRQTLRMAKELDQTVFAVHPVHESLINRFGILSGTPINQRTYEITKIFEKPEIAFAKEHLRTKGLHSEYYLAHFGIYAFSFKCYEVLKTMVEKHNLEGRGEIQLTDAQAELLQIEECAALIPNGKSCDYGVPESLIATQAALALRGPFASSLLGEIDDRRGS